MELQLGLGLGLGLPGGGMMNCKSSMAMIKQQQQHHLGFDLNNCSFDHDHDHLLFAGRGSSDSLTTYNLMLNVEKCSKRSFNEAFDDDDDDDHVPQTLPLLVWNNNIHNLSSDHQDDHNLDTTTSTSSSITITTTTTKNDIDEIGEVESGVIGWPPVKSSRKKLIICSHHKKNGAGDDQYYYSRPPSFMFVKVKMEGVGIARKVDLSLHSSYHTLTRTLLPMFGKCQEDVKSYNLTYQDKEGDWLLAGDVPWGSFIETVQRLKLLKKGG